LRTLVLVSDTDGPLPDADPAPVESDLPDAASISTSPIDEGIGHAEPPEPAAETDPVVSEPPEPGAETEPVVSGEAEPGDRAVEAVPVVSASAPATKKRPPTLPPPPPGRGSAPAAPPVEVANPDAGRISGGIATVISEDEVELVLEDGRLAVIHRRNFAPTDIADLTKVVTLGDRLEGAVLAREDPHDRVVLSRAWGIEKRAWERLIEAAEAHTVVEGKVTSVSKNGLVVDVEGVRGFVPMSHVGIEPNENLSSVKGQTLELKIIELDPSPKKRRLVLSRRSVLLKEQRKEAQSALASLVVGETRTGKVESLSDYGAFVDLGGLSGLVHVSELAWTRVRHPSEVVSVGDEIEVKILEVKVKKRRVRLSLREVAPDPFAEVEVGSITTAKITRLVDFGAFVDLGGVEGLVHLSELAEYRVSAPEELVTPGEEVMVKVLSVDKKRRRIELSIRQAISDQFG
jgi:small subunit ribosomal protein S1